LKATTWWLIGDIWCFWQIWWHTRLIASYIETINFIQY
jgi:hypothetical protein